MDGKILKSYKNNGFKISAPARNGEFELSDGSYFLSDIQNYFEYMFKKNGEKIFNPLIRIYINKIEKRITLKIRTGCCIELVTPETTKLLGGTKSKITENKNGEEGPNLEITEVVLVHCNIANNNYQQSSRALYIFVPNKSFSQLLDVSPKSFTF